MPWSLILIGWTMDCIRYYAEQFNVWSYQYPIRLSIGSSICLSFPILRVLEYRSSNDIHSCRHKNIFQYGFCHNKPKRSQRKRKTVINSWMARYTGRKLVQADQIKLIEMVPAPGRQDWMYTTESVTNHHPELEREALKADWGMAQSIRVAIRNIYEFVSFCVHQQKKDGKALMEPQWKHPDLSKAA